VTRPPSPSAHYLPFQRGLTLVELMIAMLMGLIVIGGVLGIFIANSETHRRTDDLARVQENARASVQFMGRAMREAGGNPCGLPPALGLIFHTADAPASKWWTGGDDFTAAFIGYEKGNGFPANGSVQMVGGSDALVTVSGNDFVKAVTSDNPPSGAMDVPSSNGLAAGNILFACSTDKGRGVIFEAGAVSGSSVGRKAPFDGQVNTMRVTALGKINAEAWFVGKNGREGTSLFRAFIGDNGQPEEIASDVSDMQITYLLPNANGYVDASSIAQKDWPAVIAAYIELTVSRKATNGTAIERKVGLTVNLRNRFDLNGGTPAP
jgi:type IV pilus assembly protein PilW